MVGNSASIVGLPIGSYRVIVTAGGCVDSTIVTISKPAGCDPTCTLRLVTSSTPVNCFGGSDGEAIGLTLNAGTRKLQYQLGNTGPWIRVDSLYKRFSRLLAGRYTLSARDSADTTCAATASLNIGTRVTLLTSLSTANADCGSDSGSITYTVSGGTLPYQISLDSGRTFLPAVATTGNTRLALGRYQFVLRDGSPCQSPAQLVSIGGSLPLRAKVTALNAVCSNSGSGGIKLESISGDTAIEYKVGNGAFSLLRTGSIVRGLPLGNTTILFRSITGNCTFDTTVVLTAPTPPKAFTRGVASANCGIADGVIKITSVTGTSGRFAIRLVSANNSIIYQGAFPVDSMLSGLSGGLYSLAILDSNGCRDSSSIRVPETMKTFSGSITVSKTTACPIDTLTYRLITNSTGISRQWYVNGMPVAGANTDTFAIKANLIDSISVRVTSMTSCLDGLPLTLNGVSPRLIGASTPLLAGLTSNALTTCKGASITLKAFTNLHLDSTLYRFIGNGAVIQSGTDSAFALRVDSTVRVAVLASVQGYGCLASSSDTSAFITLTALDSLRSVSSIALANAADSVKCAGQSATVRIVTNLSQLQGIRYNWLVNNVAYSGNLDTLKLTGADTTFMVQAIVSQAGSLTCMRGLPDTTNAIRITFRAPNDPLCNPCAVQAQVDSVINNTCRGDFNGKIRLKITGGTGAYEVGAVGYRPYAYAPTQNINGLPTGFYTLVIRDTANRTCADTIRNVPVNALYNLSSVVQTTRPTQCSGTPNGEIRITQISGGLGRYKTRIRNTDTLANQTIFRNLAAGNYIVTLVDDSTQCSFTTSVRIDTNLPVAVFAHALRVPSCYGDRELIYQVDSIKNGNPAYQISALNADTGYRAIVLGQPISNIADIASRTFYVKDGNGCKSELTFNLPRRDSYYGFCSSYPTLSMLCAYW